MTSCSWDPGGTTGMSKGAHPSIANPLGAWEKEKNGKLGRGRTMKLKRRHPNLTRGGNGRGRHNNRVWNIVTK